jgi:phosphoserine phosphatase RsbU/P
MHHAKPQLRRRWTRSRNLSRVPPITSSAIESAILGANQVHDAICSPPSKTIATFEVGSSIVPARHVSGDFIISFEHRGSLFVALGDLMGKGLSAAMWLTHVVDMIHRACERESELPAIMTGLNREMHHSRLGVPLTALFLARLEPFGSQITYSCGGCPSAFVLRADQTVKMLDKGGPIFGALSHATYESRTLDLNPQETLMAVSDGILEVHRAGDFELQPERVIQHLRSTAGKSAVEIAQSLTAKVKCASPVFTDDLSVLTVKRIA